ncbi:type II toxin-antitoxin system RelE/ParE family toxin [Roseibium alexandrii]|uniref:type II toxin-antitoxin system RelE/ParE family toxin n=1 Tax=Roseibium alexandrii TaxID=388408 RepID=UPI003750D838
MPQRYRLKISASADRDLTAIYEYGFTRWGEERADIYYDELTQHLRQLCDNPFLYAAVDDIRPGYRRSVCGVHSVYYRVTVDAVEVMAVIGRQAF